MTLLSILSFFFAVFVTGGVMYARDQFRREPKLRSAECQTARVDRNPFV